jgi:hypothetical protein
MPWHACSSFAPAPLRPFTFGDRALWLARLDIARRTRRITLAFAEVGRALLRRLGPDGRLDPAYATLAADTGFNERTIGRAIRGLADACLLTWQRRLVRAGWRTAQTSNAYCLVPEGQPLPAPPLKHRGSGSKAILSFAGETAEQSRDRQLAALREWEASLPSTRQTVCPGTADLAMLAGQTSRDKLWQTMTTGPSKR